MSLRDAKAATVEELKLDIRDPFTNLMAIAMAATDEYRKVRAERDALRALLGDMRIDLKTGIAIVRLEWIARIDAALREGSDAS